MRSIRPNLESRISNLDYHVPMRSLTLPLLPCLLVATAAHAEWLQRTEDGIMGTRIFVELWVDDPAKGQSAIEAVLAEMRRVDTAMSTYKPTSQISRVNAEAAAHPVKIDVELYDLLATALDYSRVTEGAFDITYASVGYLYDFRRHIRPSAAAIEQALPGIDYRHVL